MGYERWWKTLETFLLELKKKDINVPKEVMTNLKSAKTMISVYKADTSNLEPVIMMEEYLLNIESFLVNMAEKKFSKTFVESWMEKIKKARIEEDPKIQPSKPFYSGFPKNKDWIRILPSDDILKEEIKELVNRFNLSFSVQDGGYILIYGEKDKIKEFVKKMAERCRKTRKS